jgi:hypothetical protein
VSPGAPGEGGQKEGGEPKLESNPNSLDYDTWWPGIRPHYLIYASPDFMVWLDKHHDLDWKTSPELDKRNEDLKEDLGRIFNNIARLQAIPIDQLCESQKLAGRKLIGEGIARALKRDIVNAEAMLAEAHAFILARNEERARLWYLTAAGISAGVFGLLLIYLWCSRRSLSEPLGSRALITFLGASCGALGALLSILLRLGRIALDPAAGPALHYLEGAGRVIVGAMTAGVCAVAIKTGLFLPILNAPALEPAILLACFLSGASERMLPRFVKQVEMNNIEIPGKDGHG